MQIANPIYDVVFKYLLEDNKIKYNSSEMHQMRHSPVNHV
jgi:hypothetical protein